MEPPESAPDGECKASDAQSPALQRGTHHLDPAPAAERQRSSRHPDVLPMAPRRSHSLDHFQPGLLNSFVMLYLHRLACINAVSEKR